MANRVKIELNRAGVRELMRSQEMMDVCEGYANRAAGMLGEGYEVSTHVGTNRVNASVAAITYAAKKDNLKNNSILKAIGSI